MRPQPTRKNRITLADYSYQRDIENRLLMSDFSVFDVEVLEEILHSSLTLQLTNLAATLDADPMEVMEVVDKLSRTGLLKRTGEMIKVDKEMRKYYEFQALRFDEDFEPNMPFLQALLRKLPIHVLPVWYSIPRTSTNIFDSLIERYLETPKVYQRYMLELQFDEPVLREMMDEVYKAPDFRIRSKELRARFNLSREKFEEYMLILEFNFVCCLSYMRIDDQWKEVVTPFHEWREYLLFLSDSQPTSLPEGTPVDELRPGELAFASDMRTLCQLLKENPLPVDDQNRLVAPPFDPDYTAWIVSKLLLLDLAEVINGRLTVSEIADEWLALSLEDQAIAFYRHPENRTISTPVDPTLDTDKNLREVEKALSRVSDSTWLSYPDFLKSMITPIGETLGPTLQKQGRRWSYTIPDYSPEEQTFIHAAIFERLFEAGFVSIGRTADGECFRITPFGQAMLSLP